MEYGPYTTGGDFRDDVGASYFNVEGDRELYMSSSESFEDDGIPLTWRGDPELTLSDWKIMITTKSHKPQIYHVHRIILSGASGGRYYSKYFCKLFDQSKGITPSSKPTKYNMVSNNEYTRIELEARDARNIPTFLDFIYAGARTSSLCCNGTVTTAASSTALTSSTSFPPQSTSSASKDEDDSITLGEHITTSSAVSLRHLSRLFGCDALTLAINKFIQRDLSFKTGPVYFMHAYEYKDDRLLQAAKRLCAENFEKVSVNSLMTLNIGLFKELVKSVDHTMTDNTSLALSEVVYLYLEGHPDYFTAENLLDLTDPHIMPKIGPEPAVGFTALVRDLDAKPTTTHWKRLVDLCKRCAEAVVNEYGWTDFSVQAAVDEYLDGCSQADRRYRIDSLLFATSFSSALQRAQTEHQDNRRRHDKLEQKVSNLQQSIKLLEKSNKRKEEHIDAQKRNAEEAKRQILYLKKKLSEARQQPGTIREREGVV